MSLQLSAWASIKFETVGSLHGLLVGSSKNYQTTSTTPTTLPRIKGMNHIFLKETPWNLRFLQDPTCGRLRALLHFKEQLHEWQALGKNQYSI